MTEATETKQQRGRPPIHRKPMVKVNVRVPTWMHEAVKELGNVSAVVRKALAEYLQREAQQ